MKLSRFTTRSFKNNNVILPLLLSTLVKFAKAQATTNEKCYNTFRGIVNGTISIGSINDDTIWDSGFLYTGTFGGLKFESLRSQIITPTYLGCKTICGPKGHLDSPTTALGLVTTWVFPLAILLSLPYESLHKNRFKGTLYATLNWIGTPQTSLGATIYNFVQITNCHRETKDRDNDPRWTDLFYVLSIFNQFDGPTSGPIQDHFISTLIYGLYRTVANHKEESASEEVIMMREILSELAYQLRMLRRRAVIPTMASLATYIVAFVISIVLTFANLGQDNYIEPLGLGLLFGWLPVLVIFTIVDRNPVSSVRSSELMSRWLYNVDAIRTHFHSSVVPIDDNIESIDSDQNPLNQEINWWKTNLKGNGQDDNSAFKIGDFIGQGRIMKHCGLVPAILHEASITHFDHSMTSYDSCAAAVVRRLHARRPLQWYAVLILSFCLVWIQILMAFTFTYSTPSVGVGCFSGGFLIFGLLSSVSWVVQLFSKWPSRGTRTMCHVVNFLSVAWLITFTILVIIGGFNTCFCRTGLGKNYMNFESAQFYLQYCNVQSYWVGATVIGGLVPFSALCFAIYGWLKCQHLWSADEVGPARLERSSGRVDWGWLRYNAV